MPRGSLENALHELRCAAAAHAEALLACSDTVMTQENLDEACLYFLAMTRAKPLRRKAVPCKR
jgi:hypothetical protein